MLPEPGGPSGTAAVHLLLLRKCHLISPWKLPELCSVLVFVNHAGISLWLYFAIYTSDGAGARDSQPCFVLIFLPLLCVFFLSLWDLSSMTVVTCLPSLGVSLLTSSYLSVPCWRFPNYCSGLALSSPVSPSLAPTMLPVYHIFYWARPGDCSS